MDEDSKDDIDERKMPLLAHVIELRNRLVYSVVAFIVAFGVCYYFAEYIYAFLVRPLADALPEGADRRLIFTGLTETFVTYLKVAMYAGLFVSFPVIATQIWIFIAPGLYKTERRAFLPYLVATPILFFLGGALVYYFVMPLAWHFLLSFESPGVAGGLPIEVLPKVDQYLSLVMALIFAFGVSFQLPILLTLMARVGLVTSAGLASKRRYAIVIFFIIAAILTPPDAISQVALAIPLILLYEASVWSVRAVEKKRQKAQSGPT